MHPSLVIQINGNAVSSFDHIYPNNPLL